MKAIQWLGVLALGWGTVAGAATFEVTSAGDSGAGTLRWAIGAAESSAGMDTITFNLAAPYRIQPLTALPPIHAPDGVLIDGTSQPGYAGTPLVTLDGSLAVGAFEGLYLDQSTQAVIRALAVSGWTNGITLRRSFSNRVENCLICSNAHDGIFTEYATNCLIGGSSGEGNWIVDNQSAGLELYGCGNRIEGNWIGTDGTGARPNAVGVLIWYGESNRVGGTSAEAGNVISGQTTGYGVQMSIWASNNAVMGNRIGTDAAGITAISNQIGIYVEGPNNQVGGSGVGEGNRISGNTWGIRLTGAQATGNVIEGNEIGLGAAGDPLPNVYGVHVFSSSNRIGGACATCGNVISGNESTGIEITSGAVANEVVGNQIGQGWCNGEYGVSVGGPRTQIGGLGIWEGNAILNNHFDGVHLSGASATECRVEGNTLAYNGGAGVRVYQDGAVSNRISRNAIYENGGRGIDIGDLGVTTNDPGDADAGANGLQNFPVLTLASNAGATLAIGGYLASAPATDYMIEFYDGTACDSSGYGEGAVYLGSQAVTTDGAGMTGFTNAAIAAPAVPPSFITATARKTASQETSEFSRYLLVDSDGDGMPDGWEFTFFGSITGAAPDGHGDADPFTNLEEFIADTNPTDRNDFPRFADIVPEGDSIRVDMQTAPSRKYRLEDQNAPDRGSWASRFMDQAGTGGAVSWYWNDPDTTAVFRCWAYLP